MGKYAVVAAGVVANAIAILKAVKEGLVWHALEATALVAAILLILLSPGLSLGWAQRLLLFLCILLLGARAARELAHATRRYASADTPDASIRPALNPLPAWAQVGTDADDLLRDAAPTVRRLGRRVVDLMDSLSDAADLTGPAVANARINVHSVFRFIGRQSPTPHLEAAIGGLISDTDQHIGSDPVGQAVLDLLRRMSQTVHEGEST